MELKDMDIVYPYRDDGNDGRELRYSLRTVAKNVPHRNVVIIGQVPTRLNTKEVKFIPYDDDPVLKYENVRWKIFNIFHNKDISEDFIWMNDDMLIIKPIDKIPPYSWWTLQFHADKIEKRSGHSSYWYILNKTNKLFDGEWFSYEVHVPFIFNKDKLVSLFDMYGEELKGCALRSVYGNKFCKPSFFEEEFWRVDCKSYSGRRDEMWDLNNLTYISTYDEIKYAYAKRLDANFEKCIYEL